MATFKDPWLLYMGFIILLQYSSTDTIAQDKTLKYNCFKDSEEGTCEDSRVKICGDFYACDMVIKLDSPPKRIGYRNGDILFSSGGKTYGIRNGSDDVQRVNKVIPPLGELFDKKGNIYFGGDGTTYVVESGSGKEIEIITTGSYSFNQHALDTETNKLFVLSFDSNDNSNGRTGQIYAVTTDPLNIVNDKIQGELVSGAGRRITALAVQEGLDTLLLGTKENDSGKLIRLKRQRYDPCSQKETHKNALFKLIREMEAKVIELLDTSPEPLLRSNLQIENKEKEVTDLSRQNQRLKRELDMTKEKLKIFSDKILGFSSGFRKPISTRKKKPPSSIEPESFNSLPEAEPNYISTHTTPIPDTSSHKSTTSTVPDDGVITMPKHHIKSEDFEPIDCLKRSVINSLKDENYLLKIKLEMQEDKFKDFINQLDDVITNNSSLAIDNY